MAKIEASGFVAQIIRHGEKTIIRVRLDDHNIVYPYIDFLAHDWDQKDLVDFIQNHPVKVVLYSE